MNTLALLALMSLVQAPHDSLQGLVRVVGTDEGIAGARVSLRGHGDFVLTDADGRYVIHHRPDEHVVLRFERLGFQPLVVEVTAAGQATVDVDLTPLPLALTPVAVTPADPPESTTYEEAAEVGHLRVTSASAQRNPLVGESDALAGLVAAALMSSPGELGTSLRIHAGSENENLLLIDGLPWRGPRPPGGVAGILPATAIAAVDVYPGVPPAAYGNASSSVIVLQPANGQRSSSNGRVDPTAVEGADGIRFARASVFVAARRSYRPVWDQGDEQPTHANWFGDLLVHLETPAPGGSFDVYSVSSQHDFAFRALPEAGAGDAVAPRNEFSGSGSLAGMVWTDSLRDDRRAQLRGWYSDVAERGAWDSLDAGSSLQEAGASADYTSPRTEAGFTVSRIATTYRVRGAGLMLAARAAPVIAAAYLARRWTGRRWATSAGVRVNRTMWGMDIEPRATTRVTLGNGVHSPAVSLGFARMHQYVLTARNDESILDVLIGTQFSLAAGSANLPPARADQLGGAIDARLGGRTDIRLDVFARWVSRVAVVPLATTDPFADATPLIGRERACGVDATVTYPGDRLELAVQAGLLRSDRRAGVAGYHPRDPRGRMAIGAGYRFSHELVGYARFWAGSGRRTTPLRDGMQLEPAALLGTGELGGSPEAQAGALNRYPLRNYTRVDFGVVQTWRRISGTVTVSNVFKRRNVFAMVAAPSGQRPVFLPSRTLYMRLSWDFGR